jgi:hypothetical protein
MATVDEKSLLLHRVQRALERPNAVSDYLDALFDLDSPAAVALLVTDEAAYLDTLIGRLAKRAAAVRSGDAGFGIDYGSLADAA